MKKVICCNICDCDLYYDSLSSFGSIKVFSCPSEVTRYTNSNHTSITIIEDKLVSVRFGYRSALNNELFSIVEKEEYIFVDIFQQIGLNQYNNFRYKLPIKDLRNLLVIDRGKIDSIKTSEKIKKIKLL